MNKVYFTGPYAEELADALQARLAGELDCVIFRESEGEPDVSDLGEDAVLMIIKDVTP